jgi:mannose-6-phosphate isomerase-like protein (cupin superfamily)
MVDVANERNCRVINLPGRDWFYLLGPQNSGSKNLAFGLATFPPDSNAPPHVHDTQEEIIFILSGEGKFETAERSVPLTSGTAIFIPPGVQHQIVVTGQETIKLVTVFSPPVVPGEYDPQK